MRGTIAGACLILGLLMGATGAGAADVDTEADFVPEMSGWYVAVSGGLNRVFDLDYEESLRRITCAREEFTSVGLKPRGFIAPAWLLSQQAECAAHDAEMEYTTRLTSILDLRTSRKFPARSLVYSARSSWRRAASLAWNGTFARLLADAPLLRLSIHPPDFEHAEIWRQIAHVVDHAVETRTPTTYRDWIAEQRVSSRA
jgi:predicted deacetylase